MKIVIVQDGQCLLDLATRYLGDAERASEIADLNDISLTTDLVPGIEIKVPDADFTKNEVIKVLSAKGNESACAGSIQEDEGGIEFWRIERDFIVS